MLNIPNWCPFCGSLSLHVEYGRITTLNFKDGQKTGFSKATTLKTLYCPRCGAIGSTSTTSPNKMEIDDGAKTHVNCKECHSFLHSRHCANCGHALSEDGGHFTRTHGEKTCRVRAKNGMPCNCAQPETEVK